MSVFVVTFFCERSGKFQQIVPGCGVLDVLEDIWGILESLTFGCKVVGCSSLEIPQEIFHEVLLKSGIKHGFKWKQREEFMEERIGVLNIWDKHGFRVICKGLDMLE